MNLIEIFTIILVHWFADFVMQTDWQAKNKSSNNKALLTHTLTYSLFWLVPLYIIIFSGYTRSEVGWPISMLLFVPITFIAHTITDYFTSRLNSKLLHYVQLFTTYYLLKN